MGNVNYEYVGGKKFAFVWETSETGERVKRYLTEKEVQKLSEKK